jgi:hypothetical protein
MTDRDSSGSAGAGAIPLRALAVFHGRGAGFWPRLFGRPGFRHCFVALNDGRAWIVVDPCGDGLRIDAEVAAAVDLAAHYRALGYAVVDTLVSPSRRAYLLPWAFTCAETVKRILGVHGWWLWTPYQLYRRLEKEPMGSMFSPPKPKPVTPPPSPPMPEDPVIEEARKREREATKRRKGRQATILTGGLGVTSQPQVQQPTLLG